MHVVIVYDTGQWRASYLMIQCDSNVIAKASMHAGKAEGSRHVAE